MGHSHNQDKVVAESRPAFWEFPLPMGPTPIVKDDTS
jgi:hypothetical protein